MLNRLMGFAAAAVVLACAPALADPVKIVAAENFYGDIASEIGGRDVAVTSILTNPDQDPHLFEASTETAKALANAKLVIANGVDYDPWMEKLISANKAPGRQRDRRRRARWPQGRRQSASLVRSRLRDRRRQGDRRRACRGRPRP